MVNYDLPWNPNRLEQRFGRIHRIGQTEVCHLWNLVSRETREGMVFQRLFEKLEQERESLGGKVFDILGKVSFNNRSLRELLIEAIRYGNDPEVRDRLNQIVDNSMNRAELETLLQEHALTDDIMDVHKVTAIREDMERMEAHKLQPHFIEAFFLEAFGSLGGKIKPREKGRYEITHVPFAVRNRDMQIGFGEPVLSRYERVCFDKVYSAVPGLTLATIICPGHPLLEATIDLVRERHVDVLKRGSVFVDENDDSLEPRLLFYIEDAIQDGTKRVISKNVHFVEIKEDGSASGAGYAPYLDYSAPKEEELAAVRSFLADQDWLKKDVEDIARSYAIANIIPAHFSEVRSRKERMAEKTAKAVKERLTAEIRYWDYRAADLKQKEAAGKVNARLNSQRAQQRAEELEGRLHKRMAELELEKRISAMPPVIVGGALVIPRGLLLTLMPDAMPDTMKGAKGAAPSIFTLGDKKAVELVAMQAVMDVESALGFTPKDVSAAKCGYDVESHIPVALRTESTASLRFIEVKGRAKGATTVIVTKNEILTALNKPEEFILALVEVDGSNTKTTYLKKPFTNAPDFSSRYVVHDIADLLETAEVVLTRGEI